jgi:uncharacterized membrane protein YgdD (TMEM256/DUF423 family)
MNRQILVTASVFGALAVILGAFGAHALKERLGATELDNWKTAVSYQFYHTLALLFLAIIAGEAKNNYHMLAYYFFVAGMLLFCGSIYLLATRSLTGITRTSILGPITPLGGLSLILGWVFLLLSAVKSR